MSRTPLYAFVPWLLAGVVAAQANEPPPMVTDRPDQTESALTVPRNFVQIEVGWQAFQLQEDGNSIAVVEIPSTLVRYGLDERVELRFGWDGFVSQVLKTGNFESDEAGVGNMSLGAKVLIRNERGAAPQMALLFGTTLPTGSVFLRENRMDPDIRLSLSNTLSERLSLGYNVGASWLTVPDGPNDKDQVSFFDYTVALGIAIDDRWGAFVEAFGKIPGTATIGSQNLVDGGVTYLARDNLQFDLFAGLGVSDAADDWLVGLGLSIRFPR